MYSDDDPALRLSAWGAQLLQAAPAGRELLYLSAGPHAPGAALRGGVPVLFPQFALNGPLPKHGFARNRPWRLLARVPGRACLGLDIAPDDHAAWPHAARLTLETTCDHALRQVLRVENTGDGPFLFTGGLHPYWAVTDVAACQVEGLSLSGLGEREVDEWHARTGPLRLRTGSRTLRLAQHGFEGWQVWNPGAGHVLMDMPEADWRRFLCLEPVIMTPRRLEAGEVFEGSLTAAWC